MAASLTPFSPIRPRGRAARQRLKEDDEGERWRHRSQNKVSACAPSNKTGAFSDAVISTECQEQRQLTGSVCVCVCLHSWACVQHNYTGASGCVYMCTCVCVCRQKQRNPNTHWRISINITGCQSTSNNAAVIYDNVNTSSCEQPWG